MSPNDLVDVESVSFSPRNIRLERVISNEIMESEKLLAFNATRLSVRARIWEYIHREVIVRHPSTWWDAVKLRWAPRWWLRRWPVRMTEVRVTAAEMLADRKLSEVETELGVMRDIQRFRIPEID